MAFFIAACDYTSIGEELFAASAYLTREPIQLGSLYGQDRAKLFLLLMIVAGVGIATLNSVWPELGLTNFDALLQLGLEARAVNVRTRLIKLVTFLGGIYFFLEFVLPGTVFGVKIDTYHDQISNGFITIGAMAAGLGLINLIMQHGSKIIFRPGSGSTARRFSPAW